MYEDLAPEVHFCGQIFKSENSVIMCIIVTCSRRLTLSKMGTA